MGVPAGAIAVIDVFDETVACVAGMAPKLTVVAPVKPTPEIDTLVPPAGVPTLGDIDETTGTGTTYENTSAVVSGEVPPGPVTVMSR
jgi:hypothetical protein